MTPTAGQLYGSQIPTMGMNITNIATHLQKPTVNPVSEKRLQKKKKNSFNIVQFLLKTNQRNFFFIKQFASQSNKVIHFDIHITSIAEASLIKIIL